MIPPEFVRYLVEVANEKMEANRKRTDGFLRALQHSGGFVESGERTVVNAAFSDSNGSTYSEDADVEERDADAHSGIVDLQWRFATVIGS